MTDIVQTSRARAVANMLPDAPDGPNGKPGTKPGEKALTVGSIGRDLLRSMQSQFEACLPEVLPWDMFARITLTGIQKNPQLLECSQASLLGALMECARLGLAPCTEQASLVPFKGKVTLIVGYEGYVQLMYRSGQVEQVVAQPVYAADDWEYSLGDGGRFWHRPKITMPRKERGEVIFTYCYATLVGGGRTAVAHCNLEEALELQARYGTKDTSAWRTNFLGMWLKTPVRRVQKYAPKSSEQMRRALIVDNGIIDLDGNVDRPDDEPDDDTASGE